MASTPLMFNLSGEAWFWVIKTWSEDDDYGCGDRLPFTFCSCVRFVALFYVLTCFEFLVICYRTEPRSASKHGLESLILYVKCRNNRPLCNFGPHSQVIRVARVEQSALYEGSAIIDVIPVEGGFRKTWPSHKILEFFCKKM